MRFLVPIIFACVSAMSFAASLDAQTPVDSTASADSTSISSELIDSADKQSLKDLIRTLENESDRKAMIETLRLMLDAQPEQSSGLMNVFDFDSTGSGLASDFSRLMASNGISQNLMGDVITLGLTIVLVVVGVVTNGWLSRFLNKRLSAIRKRMHWDRRRFTNIFRIQRWSGYALGLVLMGYASLRLVVEYFGQDSSNLGLASALNFVFMATVVALVFNLIWEGVNALLESLMHRHEKLNSSRFQTITPIVRNVLLITLTLMSAMVVLSEVGVNIMPLLAGAGVLGIAIGFGAQTLVKDFLTGLTVIFEDLLQIGDVIRLGDKFGLVEKITLRKVQLRDIDGTVHTVPFGDVTVVSNLTKEFSYYIFEIGVAYRESVDDVIECLKELDVEFRKDEKYALKILAPLEIQGLDKFGDSAIVIKARYKTVAHERWNVGREFNRWIKAEFDKRGIEIPFPHQTIYFGEDKQGRAPKANVQLVRNLDIEDVQKHVENETDKIAASKLKNSPEHLPEKNDSNDGQRNKG